ncbi:hypothetical protein LJC57_03430 [Parabacteroides sp. OttesenSCG-928-G07]|nr:hypothetical protein [Parabacteroides sp. OttesenSCG-928-G07]
MKRLIYLLLIISLGKTPLIAQSNNSDYLFEEFQHALIVYRDGRHYMANLNYNLASDCFLFIDAQDNNTLKEFDDAKQIAMVRVGERTFLMTRSGKAQEIIQADPQILVEYKGKVRKEGKNVGYGGRSEIASVDVISTLALESQTYNLKGEQSLIVGLNKTYEIMINNKAKHFSNKTQFLKLFPKEKATLEKYIADNNINFLSIEQVIELVNYSYSLN